MLCSGQWCPVLTGKWVYQMDCLWYGQMAKSEDLDNHVLLVRPCVSEDIWEDNLSYSIFKMCLFFRFLSACVCLTGHRYPERQEEDIRSSGAGVTVSCESPDMGLENWTPAFCKNSNCSSSLKFRHRETFGQRYTRLWFRGYGFAGCFKINSYHLSERRIHVTTPHYS